MRNNTTHLGLSFFHRNKSFLGRSLIYLFLLSMVAACAFMGSNSGKSNAKASPFLLHIALDPNTQTLEVGQRTDATANVTYGKAGTPVKTSAHWKSSNKRVAKVNSFGTITAVSPGVATISASANGLTQTVKIKVNSKSGAAAANTSTPVTQANANVKTETPKTATSSNQSLRIALDQKTKTIKVGESTKATAGIFKEGKKNPTYPKAKWTSSNSKVATVNTKGKITGKSVGTATITAKAKGLSRNIQITVIANDKSHASKNAQTQVSKAAPKAVASAGVNTTASSTKAAPKAVASAGVNTSTSSTKVAPEVVASADVNTSTSSTKIAPEAVASADVNTTASATKAAPKALASANVSAAASSAPTGKLMIALDQKTRIIEVGKHAQAKAGVLAKGAKRPEITSAKWTSSAPEIATVDSRGVITGISPGTVRIHALTDEGLTREIFIHIKGNSQTTTQVAQAASAPVASETVPKTAEPTAEVAAAPLVAESTEVAAAPLVAESTEVKAAPQQAATGSLRIALDQKTNTIEAGEYALASAAILAEGAKSVRTKATWKTSNSQIATVNAQGKIVGVKPGSATISATANGQTSDISITVTEHRFDKAVRVASAQAAAAREAYQRGEHDESAQNTAIAEAEVHESAGFDPAPETHSAHDMIAQSHSASAPEMRDPPAQSVAEPAVGVIPAKSLRVGLDYKTDTLEVGEHLYATATVLPKGAEEREVIEDVRWKSSNSKVATVDSTGRITGVSPGSVTISATLKSVSREIPLTIVEHSFDVAARQQHEDTQIIPAKSLRVGLDYKTDTLEVGEHLYATATVLPQGASERELADVRWKTSNAKVAKVDSEGRIIGISPGPVTISATLENVSRGIPLTVVENSFDQAVRNRHTEEDPPAPEAPHASGLFIAIENRSNTLVVGEETAVDAGILYEGETEPEIVPAQWKSSNPKVVAVDVHGRVMALSPGKATIRASAQGLTHQIVVTVERGESLEDR